MVVTRQRETQRQKDRKTERQKDTKTERQRDREAVQTNKYILDPVYNTSCLRQLLLSPSQHLCPVGVVPAVSSFPDTLRSAWSVVFVCDCVNEYK